jgi:hypothetical protein
MSITIAIFQDLGKSNFVSIVVKDVSNNWEDKKQDKFERNAVKPDSHGFLLLI